MVAASRNFAAEPIRRGHTIQPAAIRRPSNFTEFYLRLTRVRDADASHADRGSNDPRGVINIAVRGVVHPSAVTHSSFDSDVVTGSRDVIESGEHWPVVTARTTAATSIDGRLLGLGQISYRGGYATRDCHVQPASGHRQDFHKAATGGRGRHGPRLFMPLPSMYTATTGRGFMCGRNAMARAGMRRTAMS